MSDNKQLLEVLDKMREVEALYNNLRYESKQDGFTLDKIPQIFKVFHAVPLFIETVVTLQEENSRYKEKIKELQKCG